MHGHGAGGGSVARGSESAAVKVLARVQPKPLRAGTRIPRQRLPGHSLTVRCRGANPRISRTLIVR